MSLLDFAGGSISRSPFQLERDIEDAMEGANALFDVAHTGDGLHKAFPDIAITGDATVGGDLSLTGATAWTDHAGISITADVNNMKQADGLAWDVSVMRVAADASRTITGLVPAYPDAFQLMRLINVSGSGRTITLAHSSASSDTANRFSCPGAVDLVIADGEWAELLYDPSSDVWRVR